MANRDRDLAHLEAQLAALRAQRRHRRRSSSELVVPDIDEFVHSDQYLRPRREQAPLLLPRQLTFLKLVFLQTELLTPYDYDVIGEWQQRFERGEENGIQPDIFERIEACQRMGLPWFREVLPILGRRGSKNYLGGAAGSYVLWHHVVRRNPQVALGVDPDETLRMMVIASKHDQAKEGQWRSLRNRILEAPCFKPFIAKRGADTLRIFSPHDLQRQAEEPDFDWRRATFEITAEESTPSGLRGMASIAIFFDEMGHGASPGTLASVEELYEAAKPSLGQTGKDAMIWATSTPSYQRGQLWTSYQASLARDEHGPADPRLLMLQLESWALYEDWRIAATIERTPGGPMFGVFDTVPIEYDEELRAIERRNPERFGVENRAHFSVSQHSYLNRDAVHAIFGLFLDKLLEPQEFGVAGQIYVVHVDPSRVGANTGIAIGHAEIRDDTLHVIYDWLHAYEPHGDYHEVDYQQLHRDLERIIDRFQPVVITFDEPAPLETIQQLRDYAARRGYRNILIDRQPSSQKRNWAVAENFKELAYQHRVHAHPHDLAMQELLNLEVIDERVDHPTTGDRTTKDVADAMFAVAYWLTDSNNLVFERLANFKLGAAAPGGFVAGGSPSPAHQLMSAWYRDTRQSYVGPERGGRMRRRRG